MIDVEKLKALLAGGTPGPWNLRTGPSDFDETLVERDGIRVVYGDGDRDWGGNLCGRREDLELLVAAVNALPQLLAVYEAACMWSDIQHSIGLVGDVTCSTLHRAVDAARGVR